MYQYVLMEDHPPESNNLNDKVLYIPASGNYFTVRTFYLFRVTVYDKYYNENNAICRYISNYKFCINCL